MHLHLAPLAAVTTALMVAGAAAAAPQNSGNIGTSRVPENPPAATKSKDTVADCRENMDKARAALQAGQITEKEYAEQKKMAQTKLNDTSKPGNKELNAECVQ